MCYYDFLLLLGRNNLQKYAIICPVTEILRKNITAWKCLKNWLKYGISWQIKEGKYNDKSIIRMPWQVSCTINRTLVNWGRVGHNVPQTCMNTTVSTTKG